MTSTPSTAKSPPWWEGPTRLVLALWVAALLGGCAASWTVAPVGETAPALHDPDDPALWVSPTEPETGTRILTTDKGYGLVVYDLQGRQVQALPSGRLNNVDVRGNLAFASNRTDTSLTWYRIAADGTVSEGVPRLPLKALVGAGPEIYGIGAYQNRAGALFVFVNFKNGLIVQFAVTDRGAEGLAFAEVRRLQVASQPEGVVADDELGILYVGEEDRGIWRFGAEPSDPVEGHLVDQVGSKQLGHDDVEGLALYSTGPERGYLVASSQGTHSYAVYRREGANEPLGSFRLVTGNGIDTVSETDGLELVSVPLGPRFPEGLLVVQDDKNEGLTKNFKLVSWADVRRATGW